MEQERYGLVIDEDSSDLDVAKKRVADLKAALKDLQSSFAQGNIGGARYEAELTRLQAALKSTERQANQVGFATRQAGSSGAMGILLLSQAVDDAQYGFRSIVNNIPGIGMAIGQQLGMSAETAMRFAGVLGLLAVAINVNLQHMDDWKRLLHDSGIEVDDLADRLRNLGGVFGQIGGVFGQLKIEGEVKDRFAREAKEGQGGRKQAEGILDAEAKARAEAFRTAVEAQEGGGKSLFDQMLRTQNAGFTQRQLDREKLLPGGISTTQRALNEELVGRRLGRALGGDQQAINEITGQNAFIARDYTQAKADAEAKRKEKADKEREQAAEKAAREQKQSEDEQNRAADRIARERERTTRDLARNLQKGYDARQLAGDAMSESDIAKQLVAGQGLSPSVAARRAKEVGEALGMGFEDRVRQRAGDLGIDRAGAIDSLKSDEAKRADKEADQKRAQQLDAIEAQAGLQAALLRPFAFVFKGPESIAATDFTARAQGAGGDVLKDVLDANRQQLEVLRAIERVQRTATGPRLGP